MEPTLILQSLILLTAIIATFGIILQGKTNGKKLDIILNNIQSIDLGRLDKTAIDIVTIKSRLESLDTLIKRSISKQGMKLSSGEKKLSLLIRNAEN